MANHAYQALIQGYQKFLAGEFVECEPLFKTLASGQSPKVCVISCCDSRVDPLMITQGQPGDLFVIRNVANLVPPYTRRRHEEYHSTHAGIQYAVSHLEVEHIVVLGHSQCGGIAALLQLTEQQDSHSFISDWIRIGLPAQREVKKQFSHLPESEQARQLEYMAMQVSLANLRSVPEINQRVESSQLQLHAWHFDIETGQVTVLNQNTGKYHPLLAADAE